MLWFWELPRSAHMQTDVIEKLEQQELAAILRHDWDELENLWAPNFTFTTSAMIFTKAMLLSLLRSDTIQAVVECERQILRVAIEGDVAITTAHESLTPAKGPDRNNLVFTAMMNVWRNQQDQWRLLARHVTIIARYPRQKPRP
jgi:ketosteroid isomerase-like protein